MTDVELLAPAGGIKALTAAVQSGADAVYLGADRFSARSGADNFTIKELSKWIDYCHLRGVKVHLAANTLVKEREVSDFLHYISEAYRMGVDAVIIQDIGMAMRAKQLMPELSLHASTQMTVSTAEGVLALEERGFDRVVLARELTAEQIRYIRSKTNAEIEVFVHGALCFCYSGQCLMSSIIGQRSGNRGMCAQPCRLPYELIKDGKVCDKGYLMSPKDLCLAAKLSELRNAGVNSLKIEGRLKSAEYVATAVSVYKKCLAGVQLSDDDKNALLGVFNRSGFTEGWYSGGKNMMSGKSPSNVAEGKAVSEYAKYTAENANFRKVNVDIFAEMREGEPLTVTMLDSDGNSATAVGSYAAEKANNTPMSAERLKQQLEKLGASVFCAQNTEITIDDGIVIPVSEINSVRRAAVEKLEKERMRFERTPAVEYSKTASKRTERAPYIVAVCRTHEQAKSAVCCNVKRIVAPQSVLDKLDTDIERAELLGAIGAETGDSAVMVMNMAQSKANLGKKQYGGFRLNITNSESVAVYSEMTAITLSCELNLKDIREIAADVPCEVIAYGRIPLMVMRKCPAGAAGKCRGGGGYSLSDRRGERFPVLCGKDCTSELLNSKPVYMADKMQDIIRAGIDGVQLWFYDESGSDVQRIISEYQNGSEKPPEEFTRGHFYRGMV